MCNYSLLSCWGYGFQDKLYGDLMYVKKVDLIILLISGSVCVGFKSFMSVRFLSQTEVLCFTYSAEFTVMQILLYNPVVTI